MLSAEMHCACLPPTVALQWTDARAFVHVRIAHALYVVFPRSCHMVSATSALHSVVCVLAHSCDELCSGTTSAVMQHAW